MKVQKKRKSFMSSTWEEGVPQEMELIPQGLELVPMERLRMMTFRPACRIRRSATKWVILALTRERS